MFKLRHLKFTKKLAGIEKGNHAPFSELITNGAEMSIKRLSRNSIGCTKRAATRRNWKLNAGNAGNVEGGRGSESR
jgi:hypothetical protein